MKILVKGTGTDLDGHIYDVDMTPGHILVVGGVELEPSGIHWVGSAPIEVWSPAQPERSNAE